MEGGWWVERGWWWREDGGESGRRERREWTKLISCSKEEEHSRGKEGGEEGEQIGETRTVEAINYI